MLYLIAEEQGSPRVELTPTPGLSGLYAVQRRPVRVCYLMQPRLLLRVVQRPVVRNAHPFSKLSSDKRPYCTDPLA